MKAIVYSASAMAFLTAMVFSWTSANATTTSQAIKACDANPNCSMTWGKENDSITIRVKGSSKVIDCPKKDGPCVAVIKVRPGNDGHSRNEQSSKSNAQSSGGSSGGGGISGKDGTAVPHTGASDGNGGGGSIQ